MLARKSNDVFFFNLFGYAIITLFTCFCFFPFVLMIAGSFSSNNEVLKYGYSLWPRGFTLQAYEFVFKNPDSLLRAYTVTICVTVVGTLCGLMLISMAGYVLQRKDFRYRNKISFYLYFTTIFQGGLIPWYILLVKVLHLQDTYFVLVWNMLMSPFLIILMRSFIQGSVPHEMTESAKIDGANDITIFSRIVLPMCTPALATVGLFLALAYWNDWFQSSVFINDSHKYSLQFFLYNALTASQSMSQLSAIGAADANLELPGETVKLAMSIVTMGPILFLYPFVQRYFVKGLTVGAVKG